MRETLSWHILLLDVLKYRHPIYLVMPIFMRVWNGLTSLKRKFSDNFFEPFHEM